MNGAKYKQVKISEITDYISRGITPKYVENDGVIVINQRCLRNGRILVENARVTDITRKVSTEKYLQCGDILINSTGVGTVGRVALVKNMHHPTTADGHVTIVRINKSIADPIYVYYYLYQRQGDIALLAKGSTGQVELSRTSIGGISIDLPDLATQKKIADTLSAFDDKIELNRQMNETLEEMGRALFRRYFIDNPEARNWPMVKVGDVLQSLESGSRPRGGAIESGIPSIGAENVIGLGKYDYSKEKYISISFFEKLKRGVIQSGDVLLYKDGAYVGKKTMFMNGFPHDRAAVNEHVFILRTNSKLPSQQYLYYWLDQDWITQKIVGAGIAKAAQPGINQRDVEDLPIALPPTSVVNEFNDICELLFGELFVNALESRVLVKTRDSLASKLLN